MTFQNIQLGRVVRAVLIIGFVGTMLSFGFCYCYLMSELMADVDPNLSFSEQQDQFQTHTETLMEDIYQDPPPTLNVLFLIQLGLVVLVAFWMTLWAARPSESAQQAYGYAALVFLGVLFSYGLLVLARLPSSFVVKGLFFLALIGGCGIAGQVAGQRIGRYLPPAPVTPPGQGFPPHPASHLPPGANPQTYYNMGVQAALGGRREEARQHFTRVLQMQPRNIPAWLQLANLADTPEQAWNYVQQARSINPTDPAVLDAVNVIWPKVAANAAQHTPHLQPPYPGAGGDDVAIPRTILPPADVAPPADRDESEQAQPDAGPAVDEPDTPSDEPPPA
jgi:tetratricopeptide (TPR) repeat protein